MRSLALESAITNSSARGVTYVVAAGNSSTDACSFTPASMPLVITVGATDRNDVRASFGNYGSCLDIFAPGVNITSAWYTSKTATNTLSGTSMAAAHVTGVVAFYPLRIKIIPTPLMISEMLRYYATPDVVVNAGDGSPNYLLFSKSN